MKLSDQVCTRKQAEQLKAFGTPQNAIFYYNKHIGLEANFWANDTDYQVGAGDFAAYTVAELGAMLPPVTGSTPHTYYSGPSRLGGYYCKQTNGKSFSAPTEAQARAEMLLYLGKKGLLDFAAANPAPNE